MPRYYGKKPNPNPENNKPDKSLSDNIKPKDAVDLDSQLIDTETIKTVSEKLKQIEDNSQTESESIAEKPKTVTKTYGATSKITKTYGASASAKNIKTKDKPVKTKKKRAKRKMKLRYKIIIAVMFLLALASGGIALYYYKQDADIQARWDKIKFISTGKDVEDMDTSELDYLNKDPMDRIIDWNALWAINKDVIAWIYIPGTNIDYPILQEPKFVTDGNYYYLHRNIYKDYEYMGCVLTPKEPDGCEDLEMHMQVFGHHMIGKQMFGHLDKYKSYDFYTEQPYIYIYRPDRTERWQVWAAVNVVAGDMVYKMPYEYDTQEYQDLIDYLDKNKLYETSSGKPTNVEKTLTCSTCSGQTGGTHRFTVNCVCNKTKWIDPDAQETELKKEEYRREESEKTKEKELEQKREEQNKEVEYETGDEVDTFKKKYDGD